MNGPLWNTYSSSESILYIWHLISPDSYLQLVYYITQQNGHNIKNSWPPIAPMAHKNTPNVSKPQIIGENFPVVVSSNFISDSTTT